MNYKYDIQYLDYEKDFNSVLSGINEYKKDIHGFNEKGELVRIEVLYFRNISIDINNCLEITVKNQ